SGVDLAAADELATGVPTQLEYVATLQDGYHETKTQKAVWAVKQANGDVTVFSPICTHLGCGYHWDGGSQQFKCPCHGSVFDVSGRVVGGPAPRPLDALPSKVDKGRLLVTYKEYKSGVEKQMELYPGYRASHVSGEEETIHAHDSGNQASTDTDIRA